ncbi:MAG: hypothetical protein ACYTGC_10250, partial [Planctomycetota bacterium]
QRADAQVRQAIRRYQPDEPKERVAQLERSFNAEDLVAPDFENDPIQKAITRRSELDDRYVKRLADLLGEERAAQLPPRPEAPRMMFRSLDPLG